MSGDRNKVRWFTGFVGRQGIRVDGPYLPLTDSRSRSPELQHPLPPSPPRLAVSFAEVCEEEVGHILHTYTRIYTTIRPRSQCHQWQVNSSHHEKWVTG